MDIIEFRALRRHVDDIGAHISNGAYFDEKHKTAGYIYQIAEGDVLYIEEVSPHWSESARLKGKYYLLIHREEWFSDDLEALERRLYEYAMDEELFN